MKEQQKFRIGQLVVTRGVNDLIADSIEFAKYVLKSFQRYCNCDWGDLGEEDKKMNDDAVKYNNDRIVAAYKEGDQPIYIITEYDRSATTILFPSEY